MQARFTAMRHMQHAQPWYWLHVHKREETEAHRQGSRRA